MRRIEYPGGGWIGLPDEWLGAHAEKRDAAVEKTKAAKMSDTLAEFSIALALLEDWGDLPGMSGNPENWDTAKISWKLINWLTSTVFTDLARELVVPNESWLLSGILAAARQMTNQVGEKPPTG